MDLEKIKALMEAMEDKGITRVMLKEEGGAVLELERGNPFEFSAYGAPHAVLTPPRIAPGPQGILPAGGATEGVDAKELYVLTSPMVGTVYVSASPGGEPFVRVGERVQEDTVVCIIEAMKVMNEVKAGKGGVVQEVCLLDKSPVEFGTKLLVINLL